MKFYLKFICFILYFICKINKLILIKYTINIIMGDKCYYCPRNFSCNKNVCEIEIKERENLNKRKKHVFKL